MGRLARGASTEFKVHGGSLALQGLIYVQAELGNMLVKIFTYSSYCSEQRVHSVKLSTTCTVATCYLPKCGTLLSNSSLS